MQNIASCIHVAICATAIAAFSMTTLMPTSASAQWYRRRCERHPGWHRGWRGCWWGHA